jgi:hypothetical protein
MKLIEGPITTTLFSESEKSGQPYDDDAKRVIHQTVTKLLQQETTDDKPGMLLGKIQSGKTKTFLGIVALAADNGYKQFIVLTKGTKALTSQTYERLRMAFDTSIDYDELRVFDIMSVPKLTKKEQDSIPFIIVVKKEKRNLERLRTLLFETYGDFRERKTLIVDDEADFASVGYRKSKADEIEMQSIMSAISDVRGKLSDSDFLQVTATPYSLYLQPNTTELPPNGSFAPVKPAFTELVPVPDEYVGGEVYFEKSKKPGSVESFLYEAVEEEELFVLHHSDKRRYKTEDALTSKAISKLRRAIMNFIVGGVVLRIKQKGQRIKPKKYSFIIHTESSRTAHAWQEQVIDSLIQKLQEAAIDRSARFVELVRESYDDLQKSVLAHGDTMPDFDPLLEDVVENLDAIQVEKVNSERDVMQLLDRNGQLDLRNALNVFIGGQILDRGLTIGNLIGFYYGRRANRYQQDTVLQHHRMYGYRSKTDLMVTRFYTSRRIYEMLETVHEFDSALRQAIVNGGQGQNVVFLRKDPAKGVVPCAPNKVLMSSITTLKPKKRLLPVGFQTGYKTHIEKIIVSIDQAVASLVDDFQPDKGVLIQLDEAIEIIELISKTFIVPDDTGFEWDKDAFIASMTHVSNSVARGDEQGKVLLLIRKDRQLSRKRKEAERYEDGPDSGGIKDEIPEGVTAPILMLFRQLGSKEQGWRDCPFWWPLLRMPNSMPITVFASTINETEDDLNSD